LEPPPERLSLLVPLLLALGPLLDALGERPPYMPTLTKIARGYGVSIEEVVEG
jgi:hypothetical protein